MVSQLSLVDLAGSERAVRTQNMGERLREAGKIDSCVSGTCCRLTRWFSDHGHYYSIMFNICRVELPRFSENNISSFVIKFGHFCLDHTAGPLLKMDSMNDWPIGYAIIVYLGPCIKEL